MEMRTIIAILLTITLAVPAFAKTPADDKPLLPDLACSR